MGKWIKMFFFYETIWNQDYILRKIWRGYRKTNSSSSSSSFDSTLMANHPHECLWLQQHHQLTESNICIQQLHLHRILFLSIIYVSCVQMEFSRMNNMVGPPNLCFIIVRLGAAVEMRRIYFYIYFEVYFAALRTASASFFFFVTLVYRVDAKNQRLYIINQRPKWHAKNFQKWKTKSL